MAAGCGSLKSITITPAEAAAGGASGINNGPVTLCQLDRVYNYGVISPDDKRFSASFRGTKTLGADAEAYLALNFYRNDVYAGGVPSTIRNQATPGPLGLPPYSTASNPSSPEGLTLPIYICASGVNCNASNGTLNPNNPFAAMGDVAKIVYRFGDIPNSSEQISDTYRAMRQRQGHFQLARRVELQRRGHVFREQAEQYCQRRYIHQHLLSAVADGSYNFVDPSANGQKERNFIAPEKTIKTPIPNWLRCREPSPETCTPCRADHYNWP